MFLKSTLLALAAVAALGTTVLTSTSADAAGMRGHGGHGGFRGHGGGISRISHVRHPGPGSLRPRHPGRHGHGHYWRHRHVYYVPRPVVYGVAPIAAAPVYNRCTCLTKEYTPEGAVLFKDICTNEAAINPPPAPLQTGMLPAPAQQ